MTTRTSGSPAGTAGEPPGAEDSGLRAVSRRLTTGVSVVTVCHEDLPHGGTVSTVGVVAQRPLTLCASLRRKSFLARLALHSRRIVVNVLSSRQALVADWFANPQRPSGHRQFDMVGWDPDPDTGIPLIRGALAHLACRVVDDLPIGDGDRLLVAEVTAGLAGVGRPLISFDGQLHDAEFHGVIRRRGWRAAETGVAALD